MTAYPAWTPASRPGIIPLHPLSFGTMLGRSFAALRQNPRVLLGFALVVQVLAYLVVLAAVGAIGFASFSRLNTLTPGSEAYDAVTAGSTAITLIAGLVLGLAAGALGVIVQGIVVTEVAHAAVAEKLTLRALWRQVKPVAWRLIGYSLLVMLAVVAAIAIVTFAAIGIGIAAGPVAFVLVIPVVLASIPLTLWLTIKLLLVPAAIILERATIRGAIARSWTLTRRRFWPALGVIVLISLVFGFVAQAATFPFAFLGTGLGAIVAPTGSDEAAIIGVIVSVLLPQAVSLLIQSVAIVVQSTATALIYIDCRMRHEGLDLDLLAYVEKRDAGVADLPDPFRQNVGRVIAPRPGYAPGAYAPAPPYPYGAAPQPYPAQPQYAQPYPAQAQPQPQYAQPPQYPAPQYPASGSYAPPQPQPPQPAGGPASEASDPGTPATATSWQPPTGPADGADRESPWS